MKRKFLMVAAVVVACAGLAGAASAKEAPKTDVAARQKFVALLTSVRPNPKAAAVAAKHKTGNLRAFGGGTPIIGFRGR